MDGVYTQCPATHPETGQQCVRLANTHDEHQTSVARDVWCRVWYDECGCPTRCRIPGE